MDKYCINLDKGNKIGCYGCKYQMWTRGYQAFVCTLSPFIICENFDKFIKIGEQNEKSKYEYAIGTLEAELTQFKIHLMEHREYIDTKMADKELREGIKQFKEAIKLLKGGNYEISNNHGV